MGVAILSGLVNSLNARQASSSNSHSHLNESASGTSTPTSSFIMEASEKALPSKFVATVGRVESVKKLRKSFVELGKIGEEVEVLAGDEGNVKAIEMADVILMWCVLDRPVSTFTSFLSVANLTIPLARPLSPHPTAANLN